MCRNWVIYSGRGSGTLSKDLRILIYNVTLVFVLLGEDSRLHMDTEFMPFVYREESFIVIKWILFMFSFFTLGWVNTLVGGQKEGARGFMFFIIHVDLTEQGICKYKESEEGCFLF